MTREQVQFHLSFAGDPSLSQKMRDNITACAILCSALNEQEPKIQLNQPLNQLTLVQQTIYRAALHCAGIDISSLRHVCSFEEQPGEPPVDVCPSCGATRS